MATTDLFKKHFPNVYGCAGVGLFNPNMEAFFNELNEECKKEDAIKKINSEQGAQECDATKQNQGTEAK